jgi:bisphosphoglycerate-dependent phosphoglycerate mutase
MKLEDLNADQVPGLELATGIPTVYDIAPNGQVKEKLILI